MTAIRPRRLTRVVNFRRERPPGDNKDSPPPYGPPKSRDQYNQKQVVFGILQVLRGGRYLEASVSSDYRTKGRGYFKFIPGRYPQHLEYTA